MGLASYYRRFVLGFANIARPLHRICDKGAKFSWSTEQEEAFQTLKEALMSSPILAFPQANLPFILDTDASHYAVGAVLSQKVNDREQVIAYMSKALNKHEISYCVTRKELLAVVRGLKNFHSYLYGQEVILRTDNAAVSWMKSLKNPTGQVARWLQFLETYNLKVTHRPGYQHRNADALSRNPCKPCKRQEENNQTSDDSSDERMHPTDSDDDASPIRNSTESKVSRAITRQHLQSTGFKENQLTLLGWSLEEIRVQQLADPNICLLLSKLEESCTRSAWEEVYSGSSHLKTLWTQWNRLRILGGVLYRTWEKEDVDDQCIQLIVPAAKRLDLLKYMHDLPSSGHLGIDKTFERLKNGFYWPGMKEYVKNYCKSCHHCSARKPSRKQNKAPMGNYIVGEPFERIEIDIFGPLPITNSGNRYVLTLCDCFTKWTEAIPIPDQTAATIAKAFVNNFICHFGCPLQIHSDRGSNFESEIFQNVCKLFQIDKTRTTALRPQSNGNIERFHRTLAPMLTMYCEKDQRRWDDYLPMVMMAYRSSVHASTNHTPNKMTLGRETVMPLQAVIGQPDEGEGWEDEEDYVQSLKNKLQSIHELARKFLKERSQYQKRTYDLYAKRRKLGIGQAVWIHEPIRTKGVCSKLTSPWKGPFVVTKCIDDVTYKVKRGRSQSPKVYHIDRLALYHGRNIPGWIGQFRRQQGCSREATETQT